MEKYHLKNTPNDCSANTKLRKMCDRFDKQTNLNLKLTHKKTMRNLQPI